MDSIKIWDKNDNEINLSNYGLKGLDLIPESPSYTSENENIPGMDGVIPLGKQRNPIVLTARFLAKSFDYVDSLIKRDGIYDLFNGGESFYIATAKQNYKRWLVESNEEWTPERYNPTTSEITLNLICNKAYAESIGTTLQSTTFQHLDVPVNVNDYRNIRATRFRIYNPGKPIDPRSINDHLKITMRGQSNNLQIKNLTTGDTWQYNGNTNANQTIELNGIRSTKSGLSIFRDTNKKLISLAHGWNEFEVTGSPNTQRKAVQANMPRRKMSESERPNPFTFEFIFKF